MVFGVLIELGALIKGGQEMEFDGRGDIPVVF